MVRAKENPKLQTSTIIPQVYSYIRFSTAEQSLGDSERRQLERTKAFADRKGLPFDATLRMTDRGLSGYHGYHRNKGVLGKFLQSVENGDVPAGSILVVENIDRLSREGIATTLRSIIFRLWDFGITLQTLSPEESYEPKCDNDPKFIGLWLYMNRAYDESLRKSERIRYTREKNRKLAYEQSVKLNGRCPAWLESVKDKNGNTTAFKIISGAQETIELLFDLKLKGIGKAAIVKKLNSEALWMPPKGHGWRESYIQKILQNRAVIGECQPHKIVNGKREPVGEPIPNYYPQVIDENTFYTVQQKFKENKGKGGRVGKANNIFVHLIKCAYCGGSMAFVDKGEREKYLTCDNGRRGFKCAHHSIRYDECEALILNSCTELRLDQILHNPDEQARFCQSLRERKQGYIARLRDIDQRIENYDDQIGRTKDSKMRDRYEANIIELERQKQDIQKQKEEVERELKNAERSLQSFAKWQTDLATLQRELDKDDNVNLRMRLRSHLREFIEKIEVFSVGLKENDLPNKQITFAILRSLFGKDNAVILGQKTWAMRKREYTSFCNYTTRRSRESKEGRFLRIHFKSGSLCELWPKRSIPYQTTLYINEDGNIDWQQTSSSIEWLWNEYKTRKNKPAEAIEERLKSSITL